MCGVFLVDMALHRVSAPQLRFGASGEALQPGTHVAELLLESPDDLRQCRNLGLLGSHSVVL